MTCRVTARDRGDRLGGGTPPPGCAAAAPQLTVESSPAQMFERPTWEQRFDLTTMAAHDLAATLWDNTTPRPADVDMAQL